MAYSIRQARPSDAPSLSEICLLTGDAGQNAEHLHKYRELLGLIYAIPYVNLPTTHGFVLIDDESDKVVGYTLLSTDSRAYEKAAEEQWYPPLRQKYPIEGPGKLDGTPADERIMKLFHNPHITSAQCYQFSPAHLHIDILPAYQRHGWGRKLIDSAIKYLKEHGLDGVCVGLDVRNEDAKKFYLKVGFEDIPGAPNGNMGLKFDDWPTVNY